MDELEHPTPAAVPSEAAQPEPLVVDSAFAAKVEAMRAEIGSAVVGAVVAEHEAEMTTSFAGAVISRADAKMRQSGAGAVVAGGNATMTGSGAGAIVTSGDVTIDGGLVGAVGAREVRATGARIGFVLAARTELSEDSSVMMTGRTAAIFGLALGGVLVLAFGALFGWGWFAFNRWRHSLPWPLHRD